MVWIFLRNPLLKIEVLSSPLLENLVGGLPPPPPHPPSTRKGGGEGVHTMSCLNRFFLPHTLCVTCPEVPGCHLLREMSSQWGSQKLLQVLVSYELIAYVSVFDIILTQLILVILWKGCKPNNFESRNSQKISFTNIQDLRFFVECESVLESNSPDVLALCWDKLGWLNWFWQFLCDKSSSFRLHDFSVTIPRCYQDVYVNVYVSLLAQLDSEILCP